MFLRSLRLRKPPARRAGARLALALGASALAPALLQSGQAPQQTGTVEFLARVTPAGGRDELVRGMTFFLLRKSFHDVTREANDAIPKPDLDAFLNRLTFSPELKAWMKREHSVTIIGPDFHRRLTPDDILHVPEFLNAYVMGNAAAVEQGFPTPKYHEQDRVKHPDRYQRLRKDYEDQLQKYMTKEPGSLEAMDGILGDVNPTNAWQTEERRREERVRSRAVQIAQTKYLAGKTESDLEGRGSFRVPPGIYWVSTLNSEALSGDERLRWDVALEVRSGMLTRVELSNLNATPK